MHYANPRGDTRLEVFIHAVTESQIEAVIDMIADGLREMGLANDFSDREDAQTRSLIIVRPRRFPVPGLRFKWLLHKSRAMVLPNAEYPSDDG